jgi:RNA 3'-terminal phosphate cyclase (ATP)
MFEIDGSKKSGSGTILRLSIALSTILGENLHIYNIRKKRKKPGLKPQHLEAVKTVTKLCNGKVEGATLGSKEIWLNPGEIHGGKIYSEIGTAGSIPMLILTVLPICIFAKNTVDLLITKGGTDVKYSPTINYLRYVFLPILEKMGVKSSIKIHRYGYYPKGFGEVTLKVHPIKEMFPIELKEFGRIKKVGIVSVCTFLDDRQVAERQASKASKLISSLGYKSDIQIINDRTNTVQKGSSLVLWAKTDSGILIGSDAIGEVHKSSESVAVEAFKQLYSDIQKKATVDIHLADILIPYIALAKGKSTYFTRSITDHIKSNIWITNLFLGNSINIQKKGNLVRIFKK